MTWTLGCHQRDVYALWWLDVAEANVEAVAEEERIAGHQVRLDRLGVHLALRGIWRQYHDQVCFLACLVRGKHAEALGLRLRTTLATFRQADAYVDTGVAQ